MNLISRSVTKLLYGLDSIFYDTTNSRWEIDTACAIGGSGDPHIEVTSGVLKIEAEGDGIQVPSDHAFYFGEIDVDGSWRIIRSGDNLLFQRREFSSWVTKDTITP